MAAGEHAIDEEADGPDVDAGRDRRRRVGLLGCHVERRADGGGRARFRKPISAEGRDAEVEELDVEALVAAPPRTREEDVLGLEIAVDDSRGVCGREGVRERTEDGDAFLEGETVAAIEQRAEIFAVEVLHRQPRQLEGFVDAGSDHLDDVTAVDECADLRLSDEALTKAGVPRQVAAHQLEGASASDTDLLGEPYRSHAALTERGEDAEVAADEASDEAAFVIEDVVEGGAHAHRGRSSARHVGSHRAVHIGSTSHHPCQ